MKKEQLPGNPELVSTPEEINQLIELGASGDHLPIEDLFKNPEVSQFQISPNGKWYAYLAPYKRRKNIFVVEMHGVEAKRITEFDDRSIASFFWGNDEKILFLKDSGGDENYHLYTADIETLDVIELTPYDGVRVEIIDTLRYEANHVIVAMNKNHPALFDPYRLNITTGTFDQLAQNDNPSEPLTAWQTNHDGQVVLAQKIIEGVNTGLMYRSNEEDDFREILRTNFKSEMRPLFFDFENDHLIYAASNVGRDKAALIKYDLLNQEEIEEIFSHELVDISHATYSKVRQRITSVHYVTDKSHKHILDDEIASHFNLIENELDGLEWAVVSTSNDEKNWIIRSFSDRSLGGYYLYDCSDHQLKAIADVGPWIGESQMSSQVPISYQSRDGWTIYGYLTLPEDRKGPHPMIVNPHGGPWHRDTWGFNPEVQLFASRGYAVLQMNFRGSVGYGRKFWEASFKQWGQKMQDDISDGVSWAIDQGHALKDDVSIYGGSYGGYATLAGLCYTPDLYRCGIDYVGVSNLFTFMNTIPPYWEPYLQMMYEMVGHPEKHRVMMETYSPALHADQIKVPLFVIQGANDPRVDINESDQIVQSLRSRNVQVPYMVKYDEGHGFQNEENRFEVYKAMLGFLIQTKP